VSRLSGEVRLSPELARRREGRRDSAQAAGNLIRCRQRARGRARGGLVASCPAGLLLQALARAIRGQRLFKLVEHRRVELALVRTVRGRRLFRGRWVVGISGNSSEKMRRRRRRASSVCPARSAAMCQRRVGVAGGCFSSLARRPSGVGVQALPVADDLLRSQGTAVGQGDGTARGPSRLRWVPPWGAARLSPELARRREGRARGFVLGRAAAPGAAEGDPQSAHVPCSWGCRDFWELFGKNAPGAGGRTVSHRWRGGHQGWTPRQTLPVAGELLRSQGDGSQARRWYCARAKPSNMCPGCRAKCGFPPCWRGAARGGGLLRKRQGS
jgi:hypothetical protein